MKLLPAAAVAADVDVVGRPVKAGELDGLPATSAFLRAAGFTGEAGQTVHLPGEPATVLYGLGSDGGSRNVRRCAAALARAVRRYRRAAVEIPGSPGAVRAVAEAFPLALYRFDAHRSKPHADPLERVDLIGACPEVCDDAEIVTAAVRLGRDLVNEPGGTLTPEAFAERARRVAGASGLGCEVWDRERIVAEGLGGLLAVSSGSEEEPRLVRLEYAPDDSSATIALVGKGVTFDSGGLSLKPAAFMRNMKADMAGAATVLATMSALRDRGCETRVLGYLALTDNMPGGGAVRIGDVVQTRSGKTVEVLNTDAEGRIILADALALAGEAVPDAIVNVATLTDAVPTGLGRGMAAVLGNDEALVERLRRAADRADEPLWTLPLRAELRSMLDSKIADLVNHKPGERHAGAILGALFLREFVSDGTPWAHLDIHGAEVCDADDGELVAGGTGYGVRTLLELLTRENG